MVRCFIVVVGISLPYPVQHQSLPFRAVRARVWCRRGRRRHRGWSGLRRGCRDGRWSRYGGRCGSVRYAGRLQTGCVSLGFLPVPLGLGFRRLLGAEKCVLRLQGDLGALQVDGWRNRRARRWCWGWQGSTRGNLSSQVRRDLVDGDMAKPIPAMSCPPLSSTLETTTPITLPNWSSMGPPLLPGFTGASVCISPPRSADTMPWLTVGSDPRVSAMGKPMTMTLSPTLAASESPIAIGVN